MASKSTAIVQFRPYEQPIIDLAYVGYAVFCLWDGKDKNTVRWWSEEARLPYCDYETEPTGDDKVNGLIQAKQRLLTNFNFDAPSVKDLQPFRLSQLFDMDQNPDGVDIL